MRGRGYRRAVVAAGALALFGVGCGGGRSAGVGEPGLEVGGGSGGGMGGVGAGGGVKGGIGGVGGMSGPAGAGGVPASAGANGAAGTTGVAGAGGGAAGTIGGAAGTTGAAGTSGLGGAPGLAGTPGTGGGAGGGLPSGNLDPSGLHAVAEWSYPARQGLHVHGGDSPTGPGTAAGVIHVVSAGAIRLPPWASPPVVIPPPMSDAIVIDEMLAADVSMPGSVRVAGDVTAGGPDLVRHITAGGDIFITGTLHSATSGDVRQGLVLSAGGNIYVTGVIDAAGAAPGQAGGLVTLSGKQILISGMVSSAGADATGDGAAGGGIVVSMSELFYLSGTMSVRGGVTGGAGNGGRSGRLSIDGKGKVQISGGIDARGGIVLDGAAAGAGGGEAGTIRIGEIIRPWDIELAGDLEAAGGTGSTLGGAGGTITLEPQLGDLELGTDVDASGGASKTGAPGAGGAITATVGEGAGSSEIDGGDIAVSSAISAYGGSAGGSSDGGPAGVVTLEARSYLGALTVSGWLQVDGGSAAGAMTAGGGGHVSLFTQNGDLTIAGYLSGRGGKAWDAGGRGGLGGQFNIFSDNNFDGRGGHLLLDGGVIDASGGDGVAAGGDARNDGMVGQVASFPDHREQLAVLFNCDGVHGPSQNWLLNNGKIVARGGAPNGNGGDIAYHGISPDGDASPPPGNIDNAADGSGVDGDFRGE